MFASMRKGSHDQTQGYSFTGDMEALERQLQAILTTGVAGNDAWTQFRPHVDKALESAGKLWPLVDEEVERMLSKHSVARTP